MKGRLLLVYRQHNKSRLLDVGSGQKLRVGDIAIVDGESILLSSRYSFGVVIEDDERNVAVTEEDRYHMADSAVARENDSSLLLVVFCDERAECETIRGVPL